LKVCIGSEFTTNPYGGGNLFIKNLAEYLLKMDHSVVYDLKDIDIDIILMINPLKNSEKSTLNNYDIYFYQKFINPESISVQRINECDERKNTDYVNKAIIKSNKNIDYTVYVSKWLQELYEKAGMQGQNSNVILAGANSEYFNIEGKNFWDKEREIRLVTHHWSDNWMKGFKTYKNIDKLLSDEFWNNKIIFTYIGNYPKNINFENTKLIKPLGEKTLAQELKRHDIYITASLNEPSGNHHIEAAQCGLPILYVNSGGVTEYCQDYGLEFSEGNIAEKLEYLINNYDLYKEKIIKYPLSANAMSEEFLKLFKDLVENKEQIIINRKKVGFLIVLLNKLSSLVNKYIFNLKRAIINLLR
jgi:glycosyltransferase involved in cell wall biosynthesis